MIQPAKPIIVLHHGLFGFNTVEVGPFHFSYFHKIDRALMNQGYPVIIPSVHPTGGIERRARKLKSIISEHMATMSRPNDRVIIVAHSLGGLDARHMITHMDMASRVSALLTISTPHRGTPFAAWCLRYFGRRLGALKLLDILKLDFEGVHDLTPESCQRFNERTPDHPDVKYFSISAARPVHRVPPWAMHSCHMINELEGANDGLVSVQSSTWGEHLGVWAADHWHTVNRRFVLELRDATGDVTPLYFRALEHIQQAVSGALMTNSATVGI